MSLEVSIPKRFVGVSDKAGNIAGAAAPCPHPGSYPSNQLSGLLGCVSFSAPSIYIVFACPQPRSLIPTLTVLNSARSRHSLIPWSLYSLLPWSFITSHSFIRSVLIPTRPGSRGVCGTVRNRKFGSVVALAKSPRKSSVLLRHPTRRSVSRISRTETRPRRSTQNLPCFHASASRF